MPLNLQPMQAPALPTATATLPKSTIAPTATTWYGSFSGLRRRLPGVCALCARTGPHVLCEGCTADYFGTPKHRCACCASPLPGAASTPATCAQCLRAPPAFDATIASADYAAPIDRLVLELKFGNRLALATLFAERLYAAMTAAIAAPTAVHANLTLPMVLTAVPLGAQRLQQRGFNQALEIAKPLAAALDITLAPRMLVRNRETAAQAQLSPAERRQNLRGAFHLAPAWMARVRGCHVGVVDDVMTTGQTLNEIAATLKRFGALRVTNLVFARTLLK